MNQQPDLFSARGGETPERRQALSVSSFNERVASFLKGAFPGKFRIQGFVDGFARSWRRGAHVYFDLTDKDPADESKVLSRIGLVLWRGTRTRLRAQIEALGGPDAALDDMQVYFEVSVNYWVPGGRLSLVVEGIDLEASLGAMKLDRDRILRLLAEEGLLDRNRSLALPALPLRIGLITSLESAAYHDFLKELALAGVAFRVGCRDSRVQGLEQEGDMLAAMAYFARHDKDWDVLVIIRGGGSRSDLAGFDSEKLARAMAACPLPVLTGIGHEIDRSVADELAHRSFKTPTAVANFLAERVDDWLRGLDELGLSVGSRAEECLADARRVLEKRGHLLGLLSGKGLSAGRQRLTAVAAGLPVLARRGIQLAGPRLRDLNARLATESRSRLRRAEREIEHQRERLRLLDPINVLRRGFSITRRADGSLLRDTLELQTGEVLTTRLSGGSVESEVRRTTDTRNERRVEETPGNDEEKSR